MIKQCSYKDCSKSAEENNCKGCGLSYCKKHMRIHSCSRLHSSSDKEFSMTNFYIVLFVLFVAGVVIMQYTGYIDFSNLVDFSNNKEEIIVPNTPQIISNEVEIVEIGPDLQYETVDNSRIKILDKTCSEIDSTMKNNIQKDQKYFEICRDYCADAEMMFGGERFCNGKSELFCNCI